MVSLQFGLVPPLAALRFRSGGGVAEGKEGKEAAAASEGPLLPGRARRCCWASPRWRWRC